MNIGRFTIIMGLALGLSAVHAANNEPQIASNTSGISDAAFIQNVARSSMGMGAKEPLSISASQNGGKLVVVVSGSNGTNCTIPTNGNPPQMQGIQCK